MNKTRKSLLTSALSLLLCCAMLVGTTLAWFTDSVTSSKNIIQTGTLDIVLEYYDGTNWVDVKDSSEIFDEDALWEPGYVQTAYVRMRNAGTLALTYHLGLAVASETPGTNVAGAEFLLSDHIYLNVVKDVEPAYASRIDALAVATEEHKISEGFYETDVLNAESDYVYYALVAHMPTTTGNEANYRGTTVPTIELGLAVSAGQAPVESDSFDNQYDADTTEKVEEPGIEVTLANYKSLVLESDTKYSLTGDFEGNNVAFTIPEGIENITFDGKNSSNINEFIVVQNGSIIDNIIDVQGERSGYVVVENFTVLSQINVFASKTTVEVLKNNAEALMIHAGNCDVNLQYNTIDAKFESHPTYRDEVNTWNNNDYGIALNIFDYDLYFGHNNVTNTKGHAIGINGWQSTFDIDEENTIHEFYENDITVNSTAKTKRAALKIWDDETYADKDEDTNVVNAKAQELINMILADSNTFNILEGYDHTIFSIYSVNTNN